MELQWTQVVPRCTGTSLGLVPLRDRHRRHPGGAAVQGSNSLSLSVEGLQVLHLDVADPSPMWSQINLALMNHRTTRSPLRRRRR